MSKLETAAFLDCLSAGQDRKLINIKFFRGSEDLISEAELRAEVCASEERKLKGALKPAPSFPRCKKAPIDVRQLVANK